jgi:signal transduction histidine kinase
MSQPRSRAAPAAKRLLGRLPWAVLLLSAGEFASLAWRLSASDGPARYWLGLAAAVLTVALVWRRRYPVQVWAAVTVGCALLMAFLPVQRSGGIQVPPLVFAAPVIALYALSAGASRRRGRAALLISALALSAGISRAYLIGAGSSVVAGIRCVPGPRLHCLAISPGTAAEASGQLAGLQLVLILLAVLTAAWALGERERASSDVVTALAERSAALDAERAGRERAAVADERARIAAELHDITAHHISVVALQAGAARILAESGRRPDIALLRGIELASRQAMTEIREALGVIRGSGDGPVPMRRTGQLPELAERLAVAGLKVTFQGSAGLLAGQLDLTVYRIIQESLSNVLRHSAARSALVRFRRLDGQLEVLVTDDGPARERSGPAWPAELGEAGGQGLAGLRERVRRLGGQLQAGSRPDGGFEVRAWLPVPGADRPMGHGQPSPDMCRVDLPAESEAP